MAAAALMASASAAKDLVDKATAEGQKGVVHNGKKLRLNLAPPRDGEEWPPADHEHRERPPIM